MKRGIGITSRITAVFLAFSLGLLLIVGLLAYHSGRAALEAAAVSELLSSALEKEAQIDQLVALHEERIGAIAASPILLASLRSQAGVGEAAQLARASITGELKAHTLLDDGEFIMLGVAARETGTIISATSATIEGRSVAAEPFFQAGLDAYHVAAPARSPLVAGPAMTASAPVRDAGGTVAGVVIGWIDLKGLSRIVRQRSGLHRSDDVYLINPAFQFVTLPRFGDGIEVLRSQIRTGASTRCLAGNSGVLSGKDYRNVGTISVYRWLPRHKLCLITKIDTDEAFLLVRDFREELVITGILLLLVSSASAVWLARTITRPVHKLQQAVVRFANGESDVEVPVSMRDEVDDLAHEFKRMAVAIGDKETQLRSNAAQLEQRVQDRTQALQRQANLLDLAHDAIVVVDRHGVVTYWNGGAVQMYGCTQDEALGAHFQSLVGVEDDPSGADIDAAPADSGHWDGRLTQVRRDGAHIAVASRQARHFDEHAGSDITLIINSDVTERRLAEEELTRFFDLSPDLLCIASFDGYFKRLNPAWEATLGLTREELTAEPYAAFIHPDDLGATVREVEGHNHGLETVSFENRYRCKDGSYRWLSWHAVPIVESGRVYAVAHDVTERNRAEQELNRAKEDAEAATRAKSAFLANMSHEIRTPMNGVIGLTALVLKTDLTPEQREYMQLVKGSAASLLRLLNDILDFSKIEEGMLTLDAAPFDLRETIGDTLKAFTAAANDKGLELTYQVAPEVPTWLMGDPGRLGQILINLTGNALKFTSEGEVVVRADLAEMPQEDGSVIVHFSVTDTGIGIAHEQQEHIFKEFVQADTSTTRRYGGTGLGLAIVTQLVALMGGTTWVVSAPGQGTVFHFTARMGMARDVAPPAATPTLVKDLKVLVVDDNRSNLAILGEILDGWNMRPTLAGNGDQAILALAAANAMAEPFSLILLDAQMPGFDGFQLAEHIRALPGAEKAIIMMLSSSHAEGEEARCKALGNLRFLRKPIKQSELFDAIIVAMGAAPLHQGEHNAEGGLGTAPARALRVLVVEDHPVNQTLVTEILRSRGHFFALANNGVEALSLMEIVAFDAVLMDGQMPVMDGYEATREIRRREQGTGRHIHIVALTANAMKEDRDLCLAAGMDDYVAKPIEPDELLARLEGIVGSGLVPASTPASYSGFDLARLQQRARGKVPLLRQMVQLFLDELPSTLEMLRTAAASDDMDTLARAAHRLKGAAATLSAHGVADAATTLEQCAHDANRIGLPAALYAVRAECEALAADFERLLTEHT